MKKYVFGLPFAIAVVTLFSSAQATVIVNGGFEVPAPLNPYLDHYVGNPTLFGWEIVGTLGDSVSQVRSDFNGNPPFTFPAQEGNVWLDLAGFTSNSPVGVRQTIITNPGSIHQLNFFVGNVIGGPFGISSTVGVEFDSGGVNFNCSNAGDVANPTVVTWTGCSATFTATNVSTALTFRNLDPSTDFINALDNISVNLVGPGPVGGVPEPATWATMILGFGAIGAAMRRTKRRRPSTPLIT